MKRIIKKLVFWAKNYCPKNYCPKELLPKRLIKLIKLYQFKKEDYGNKQY